MVGLGQIALHSAPWFGGAMLAIAAGQFKGPDYRGLITEDKDLLDRLPPEATQRRAELQGTINDRIDDLVDAADRSRAPSSSATARPIPRLPPDTAALCPSSGLRLSAIEVHLKTHCTQTFFAVGRRWPLGAGDKHRPNITQSLPK